MLSELVDTCNILTKYDNLMFPGKNDSFYNYGFKPVSKTAVRIAHFKVYGLFDY